MKKSITTNKVQGKLLAKSSLNPAYSLLLLTYLLAPVFTPNFYTLDSAGPKFVTLALLNLVSFFVLLFDKDFKQRPELKSGFFLNLIGLAYSLFLFVSLLSFFQAYNLSESVVNFAKLSSVFAAIYILYVIFSSNKAYLQLVALAFSFLLILDSISVFYHILEYVNKNVDSIYDIKSVYSHKNILSAALFIKIPAAIWLMIFGEAWKKKLGYFASFLGAIAVLFMSSRAFYLGLAILVFGLAAFFITRHFVSRNNLSLKKVLLFTVFFVVALVVFSLIQQYFYPENNKDAMEKVNTGVWERMSTIKADESSTNARLTTWKRSFKLIKEHPILGVGTGNWKIEVLRYEAPLSDSHIISYKNHNDFIEVMAETGLVGGLLYLSMFFLILFNLVRSTLNRSLKEDLVKHLFLPAFGILAYSVDAFFNFPNDRPEIQVLFAMYVSMAIAFSDLSYPFGSKTVQNPPILKQGANRTPQMAIIAFALFLIVSVFWILFLNAKSMHYQLYVVEDTKAKKDSHPSSYFINAFPSIPELSCDGAPITTYIARYLINENKAEEAIRLLSNSNPSPYDGRREYYLSMAYNKLGDEDSSIAWGKKACALKPLHATMVLITSSKLFQIGKPEEAGQILDSYLSKVKTNPDAWLQASNQCKNSGNEVKALLLLDTAKKYLPGNNQIIENWNTLHTANYLKPFEKLYSNAVKAAYANRYSESLNLLNDFISKRPKYAEAYQFRAYCEYNLMQYQKSLKDIEKALKRGGGNKGFLLNLKGLNFIGLGKTKVACNCFVKSKVNGNKDGLANYNKFCKKK